VAAKGNGFLRFRVPEIILGALLAVAIFAMGMVFASSRPDFSQAVQIQEADEHGEKAKTPDGELTGLAWFTKDAAGFFTFLLVVVGIGQVVLFYVQLRLIRTSLDDTKLAALAAQRAAKATEDAVELSRETAQQQLRAYFFITKPRIVVFNQGKKCVHEMLIRNYGQTPAHDVVVITNTDFFDPNPIAFPELEQPKGEISRSSIAPSGEIIFTTVTEAPLTVDQLKSVASGKQAFFVWGEIRYTDVFSRPQITHFRLRFGRAQLELSSGTMMICDDGNRAT
jgi:uncharacterized protein (UPF0333 family)